MLFPQKINVVASARHTNPHNETVVVQNDTAVEFYVAVVGDNGQTELPEGATYTLVCLHLRKQPTEKLGTLQEDGNVMFKLTHMELSETGPVQGQVRVYHPVGGRLTSNPFIFHVAPDPTYGAEIKPEDQSIIEQVIGEGPAIIAEAKKETELSITERARLTGAVGGALSSLADDKAQALLEMSQSKDAADQSAQVAHQAATNADEERERLTLEVEGKLTEVETARTETIEATGGANVAAQKAIDEAEAARLQKEEVQQVLGAGPVASVNGETGVVTGLATQESVNQVTAQLADITGLGRSNGTDDTTHINNALENKGVVKGLAGETYIISSPLIIPSDTTIDMTGCTVKWKNGVTGNALIRNQAFAPQRTMSDAAITKGETVLNSATGAFSAADIGRTVCVHGAGGDELTKTVFTADIVSVTSSTSVVLSDKSRNTVTNATVRVHNRDKNINVIGGIWDRGAAVGNMPNLHGMDFRHVDYISVHIQSYRSVTHGAKYAALFGSAHYIEYSCQQLATISDGLHINGPASKIHVPYLGGETGDDFISLTGADYPHYADTSGDIVDMHVVTASMDNARAGYKILAGAGNIIDNFKADVSMGTTRNYGAWIGQDPMHPDTTGGRYGEIDMGEMRMQAGGDLVRIVDVSAKNIKIVPRGNGNIHIVRVLDSTSPRGGVIENLVIESPTVPKDRNLFYMEGNLTTIKNLHLNNVSHQENANLTNMVGGKVGRLFVNNANVTYKGSSAPIRLSGGEIGEIILQDSTFDLSEVTGGVAPIVLRSSGVGNKKITLVRSEVIGSGAQGFIAYSPTNADMYEVVLENTSIKNLKRLWDGYSGNARLFVANSDIDTALEPIANGNAEAEILVTGTVKSMRSQTVFAITAVGNLRVNGDIPAFVNMLTPNIGDVARNRKADIANGWFLGPVTYDGSKWIPSRGFAESGNATLSGGSVIVYNNKITATSRVRIFAQTRNGTPGAMWVELNAGTGFTIKSSSTNDTSTVRWEIVAY